MKMLIITLLMFPVLAYGGDTNISGKTSGEKWYSKPRLERIAKEYAKQHKMAFDFANTHSESRFDPWKTNVAIIDFYHGMYEPCLQVKIDPKGNVIEATIAKLMPAPPPEGSIKK